jgi:hypothetical protein
MTAIAWVTDLRNWALQAAGDYRDKGGAEGAEEGNINADQDLASLISRPVADAGEFRVWLTDAEVLVQNLQDKNAERNERTNTHNSPALCRVAERLHDLANERAMDTAMRCKLPGQPSHSSKAEVLGNLRRAMSELSPTRGIKKKQSKPKRGRGRPEGSETRKNDLKLWHDYQAAHRTTRISKAEFVRERGLDAEEGLAALERGRKAPKEPREDSGNKSR